MSKKQKRIFWPTLLLILAAAGVLGLLSVRTRAVSTAKAPIAPVPTTGHLDPQPARPPRGRSGSRNLSMQPEAFRLSRAVGQRFADGRRGVSVLTGTLMTGSEHRPVRIQRQQNDRGEKVEIAVGGGAAGLSWSDDEGARSRGHAADEGERLLIERLAFDSIDQFVLAQLRGASYYTVQRNARLPEAQGASDYSGPLWDVVRVDDPETDAERRPVSKWRLYYINSRTGLIDKVISEVNGERVETNFVAWGTHAGEKVPTRITWYRQGQLIMEFQLNNFAHNRQS